MGKELGNKPKFEDKEGNIKLAIFKNKNSKGTVYPLICISVLRFPFKYSQKLYINRNEIPKIIKILERVPEINIKQRKNPKKVKI